LRAKTSAIVQAATQITISTAAWDSGGAGNVVLDSGEDNLVVARGTALVVLDGRVNEMPSPARNSPATWVFDNSDAASLEFYFRDEVGYRTTDFQICEPVWAQLARLSGAGVPSTWTEPTVVSTEGRPNSSPYPGITRWNTDEAFGQQDLTLFDPATMLAIDRGAPGSSPYEDPAIAATTWVTLEGNWPIIGN
jgi:hypothetical protein